MNMGYESIIFEIIGRIISFIDDLGDDRYEIGIAEETYPILIFFSNLD